MKQLTLRKGREDAIRRRSPWVFSGAIFKEAEGIEDGELVQLIDAKGEQLAIGDYQAGSIRVRLLHFGAGELPETLLRDRLAAAFDLRKQLGLADDPLTNAYRLVHAAGDELPGLIVDRYGDLAVLQCHSIAMHLRAGALAQLLIELSDGKITSVYDKSAATLPERYAATIEDGTLAGEAITEVVVLENGRRFRVDVASGQKTGFFLDQRENRWLLGGYAQGKRVLNTFCYTGGFSVYAALGGAEHVDSVDLSAPAIALTEENVDRNGEFSHVAYAADVLEWLKEHADKQTYDIVVVDPPAYAKNKHKRHKAVQAYKRLNARAMRAIKPGGLLFTFSCSRVVDRQLFYDTIVAAGLEAGRPARVLHQLSQGPDHPVSLFHAEGSYLKGLVVRVD